VTIENHLRNYVFTAADRPILSVSASLSAIDEACVEYFQVALKGDDELKMLMKLLGVDHMTEIPLVSSEDFSAVFDFSATKLPQLSGEDFDKVYDEWLLRSGRQTSMDEYGQLIFLRGCGDSWNAKAYRFVLREKA
jgi:hypothetical protein